MILFRKRTKLIALLITVLFLYNSLGYLFLYFPASHLIKHFVHKALKEKKINSEDLSILAFNLSDLKNNKYDFIWKKPGKEFRFNGKMFDIEDKVESGDTVYYTVYYDHNENILEELFSLQQLDNKKDKSQNTIQRVLLVGLYYEQLKYYFTDLRDTNSSNLLLNKNEAVFHNYISDVPTPPPRNIV
jgi:hypothetical protein